MSLENLLDHTCDIYHLKSAVSTPSFGMNVKHPATYRDEADIKAVDCHFEEVNQTIVQGEPNAVISQSMRVTFMPDVDVRLNDKVVWEGVEYRLQKPKSVRGHHIVVRAVRSDNI